jgi:hypothetical protein
VKQRDSVQFPFVDGDGVHPWRCRNLVADRDDCVEALIACDINVILYLIGTEVDSASLDFDQGRPFRLAPRDTNKAIRSKLAVLKWNLNVCFDCSRWGATP